MTGTRKPLIRRMVIVGILTGGGAVAAASTVPNPPAPPSAASAAIQACRGSSQWLAGAAKTDITGPMVDISTGYTEPGVTMEGLQTRLHARGFVLESPCSGQRVAYVNAEMLHTYQSIKTGVMKKLAAKLPGVYSDANVMIVGTHDHAAPGNTSFRTLYNLANGVIGFDELNYNIVVDGIVDAIVRAHNARRPATLALAKGTVANAAFNRSLPAYQANPDAANYSSNVDTTMTLLKMTGTDGKPIGAISWFGVHGTSLDKDVHVVDGDNKGMAALRLEKTVGGSFVAAFSNAPLGDVSPNQPDPANPGGDFLRPHNLDSSLSAYDDARVHAERQYAVALNLFNTATSAVTGGLFYKHQFVEFQNIPVSPAYTGGATGAATCTAAIGAAFVSGTEEGGTKLIASLKEGSLSYQGIPINPFIPPALQKCQAEKQVLLPVGDVSGFWVNNIPWVDTIVPFQVFAIGNLGLVASSFEQTTMSGRRLRNALKPTLAVMGVNDIVIPTIANAYHQYLTTREEYAVQNYEGGFTHFGPWSSAAFIEHADIVARSLVTGGSLAAGPTPPDLLSAQAVHTPIETWGVVNDAPPSGKNFGDVVTDAAAVYAKGNNRVSVTFWSAHPRTVQLRQRSGQVPADFSYLEVQRWNGSAWERHVTDSDPFTRFIWKRIGGGLSAQSQVTIDWDLDLAPPGSYRIVHRGVAKKFGLTGPAYQSFSGASRRFDVR